MSIVRTTAQRRSGDGMMLSRLGWRLQQNLRSETLPGVSLSRLTHSAARMLLDWQHLALVEPRYKELHTFVTQWTPYRFGSVASQGIGRGRGRNRDNPPLFRWFLDDLLREEDHVLGCLGCRLTKHPRPRTKQGTELSSLELSRATFESNDVLIWRGACTSFDVNPLELELVDELVQIYWQLSSEDTVTIASCPTPASTQASLWAEIYLWQWEFSHLLETLAAQTREFRAARVEREIRGTLNRAYACAAQIPVKIDKAAKVASIRDQKMAAIKDASLLSIVRSTLIEQQAEDYAEIRDAGAWLAAVTFFAIEAMESCGIQNIINQDTFRDNRLAAYGKMDTLEGGALVADRVRHAGWQGSSDFKELGVELDHMHVLVNDIIDRYGLPTRFRGEWWDDIDERVMLSLG